MSTAPLVACVVTCALALVLVLVAVAAAAASLAQTSRRNGDHETPARRRGVSATASAFADKNERPTHSHTVGFIESGLSDDASPNVVPGRVMTLGANAEPAVVVDGRLGDTALSFRLSSTDASVRAGVPKSMDMSMSASTSASPHQVRETLALDIATLPTVCGPISITYTGTAAVVGVVDVDVEAGAAPMLGLGAEKTAAGAYKSPVLALLAKLHAQSRIPDVAWVIGQDAARITLSFGVPQQQCFSWCWSPMRVDAGCYVVALKPSASQPHTHALFDVSHWASFLPNVASAATTIVLQTTTGCSIIVRAGTFVTKATPPALSPNVAALMRKMPQLCILGMSAGLDSGGIAFDLLGSRVGIAATVVPLLTSAVPA